jgi:hypothetical protein
VTSRLGLSQALSGLAGAPIMSTWLCGAGTRDGAQEPELDQWRQCGHET